ncbi:MAG: hypothetical protein ABW068_15255 [Candidatus Thiodiazotropha sp.]
MSCFSARSTTLARILLTTFGATVLFQAQASDDCPIVSTQDVTEAFDNGAVMLLHADASGMCSFGLQEGGSLSVQVVSQPSEQLAGELYKTFKKTDQERLPHAVEHDAIGDKSHLVISPEGAESPEVTFTALKKDQVIALHYYPNNEEMINDQTVSALLELGKRATSQSDQADQQFGACEWLPDAELDRFLGQPRTVQRLGPDQCLAYAQPGNKTLMVMSDHNTTDDAYANMRERHNAECTTVSLPKFGPNSFAYYDCSNPGNQVMSVDFFENGVHMMLTYEPGEEPATGDDLKTMDSLIEHVYKELKMR